MQMNGKFSGQERSESFVCNQDAQLYYQNGNGLPGGVFALAKKTN
jgi:hypothetical protein